MSIHKLNLEILKRIGILSKGKGIKILNNTIVGVDIGIQDEGEDTVVVDNKII